MPTVTSVINSERGVTLSRLSMLFTPVLFAGLLIVSAFVINGKFSDLDKANNQIAQLSGVVSDLQSQIKSMQVATDIGRQDRSAYQATSQQADAEVKAQINGLNTSVNGLSNNVAGLAAKVDLLSSKFLGDRSSLTLGLGPDRP